MITFTLPIPGESELPCTPRPTIPRHTPHVKNPLANFRSSQHRDSSSSSPSTFLEDAQRFYAPIQFFCICFQGAPSCISKLTVWTRINIIRRVPDRLGQIFRTGTGKLKSKNARMAPSSMERFSDAGYTCSTLNTVVLDHTCFERPLGESDAVRHKHHEGHRLFPVLGVSRSNTVSHSHERLLRTSRTFSTEDHCEERVRC